MAKTTFRVTEVREYTFDVGDVIPNFFVTEFGKDGMVGDWGFWDFTQDYRTTEFRVEIVEDGRKTSG